MNDSILDKLDDALDGTDYEVTFGHNPESMMIELIHGQEIICVGQVTDGQLSGFGLPTNKKHHDMWVVVKKAIMEMLSAPKQDGDQWHTLYESKA